MVPCGIEPATYGRKTIALTTELKEPLHAGAKLAPLGPGKQRDGAWPLFAKVCQFVTSCVLLNKAARRRLAFPRVSKNLKVAPFQSPPGQMAAFVSVLEAKAKDAGTAKNDHKQVETRSHSMIRCRPAQHGSLWD